MHLEDIREFLIPEPGAGLQDRVESAVIEAYELRRRSRVLYRQAEAALLEELGLADLDLSPQLFYERRYSATVAAHRLDAEYFSPRAQRVLTKLGQQGKTINDVVKLAKRRFRLKPAKPFNCIEIGDVKTDGSAFATEASGENAPSRAVWIV